MLIEDAPEQQDLLSHDGEKGPHRRVAEAIVDLLGAPSIHGARMIALEGAWGSGKTTVINLVRGLLENQKDEEGRETMFVCLDSWAHEGDTLRRTFLEELIERLIERKWVCDKTWTKERLKLSCRLITTTIERTSGTTPLAKAFGISLLLLPVGNTLLSNNLSFTGVWATIFGWIFLLAPFLVILWRILSLTPRRVRETWVRNRLTGWSRWSDESFSSEQKAKDWAFLSSKIDQEVEESNVQPEPTSVDFEQTFRMLMKEALGSAKSTRALVLVFDNLDRVQSSHALRTWSTLQIFLRNRGEDKEQWMKQLTILVPYDPSGLQHLWGVDRSGGPEEKEQSPQGIGVPGAGTVSDSFLDKSFQIRFELPPPVQSNWLPYLEKLLRIGLPDHDENELKQASLVFSLVLGGVAEARTPRELKLYVNQIGAIHRQWPGEFPLAHIAYYTALRRRPVDIRKALLNKKNGQDPLINIGVVASMSHESDLRDNLAGLYFNVPATLGRQLLLSDPIVHALTQGDAEALARINETNKAAFLPVCRDVLLKTLSTQLTNSFGIANVAIALKNSGVLAAADQETECAVVRVLSGSVSQVPSWSPLDEKCFEGISALLVLVRSAHTIDEVLNSLRATIAGLELDSETPKNEILLGLSSIVNTVEELGHSVGNRFELPGNASVWIDWCSLADNGLEAIFKRHVAPSVGFNEISAALTRALRDNSWDSRHLRSIEITDSCCDPCIWTNLVSALQERLQDVQQDTPAQVIHQLDALALLQSLESTEARDAREALAKRGFILHWLQDAKDRRDIECQAWCVATYLELVPDLRSPSVAFRSAEGHSTLLAHFQSGNLELARKIVAVLAKYRREASLLEVCSMRQPVLTLVLECLRSAVEAGDLNHVFPVVRFRELWKVLKDAPLFEEHGTEQFDGLVKQLTEQSSLLQDIVAEGSEFRFEEAGLYSSICRVAPDNSIQRWCMESYRQLEEDRWVDVLARHNEVCGLLSALIADGHSFDPPSAFDGALVKFSNSLVVGEVPVLSSASEVIPKLLDSLSESRKIVIASQILSTLRPLDNSTKIDEVFSLFGTYFLEEEVLRRVTNECPRWMLAAIQKQSTPALGWVDKVIREHKEFVKSLDGHDMEVFRNRIGEEVGNISNESGDYTAIIRSIAAGLGLDTEDQGPSETP